MKYSRNGDKVIWSRTSTISFCKSGMLNDRGLWLNRDLFQLPLQCFNLCLQENIVDYLYVRCFIGR